MCDYCDKNKYNKFILNEAVAIKISDKNKLLVEYEDYFDNFNFHKEIININYCPICGRKLK